MKTKRKQSDRNHELFNALKQTISGHWYDVRKSQCTFAQYLERAKDMRTRLDWQGRAKLPDYMSFALDAYNDALYSLNAWEKVWVHTYDGRAYIGWDALPEAGKEAIRATVGLDCRSVHVWPGAEVVNGAPISSLKLWGDLPAQ
jgi:hypothetical protein